MVFVGTSGWIYPHWRGTFYPRELVQSQWLRWLTERLGTVEINATFYRMQRPECFERWRESAAPGTIFAVKASRYVTHMLKLTGGTANFFAQGVLRLGAQLGPILWQLPPMLGFSRARAEPFLDGLPRDLAAAERLARKHDERVPEPSLRAPDGRSLEIRHALEVRHPSWLGDEALALLGEYDVALVAADTAGRFPRSVERTASFAYARLHGAKALYDSRYSDEELAEWARLVERWRGDDVYVYFDNDHRGYAPNDAMRLTRALGDAALLEGGPHAGARDHGRMQRPHRMRLRRDQGLRPGGRRRRAPGRA